MSMIVILYENLATARPYGIFEQVDKDKKYFNFDEIRIMIEK